MSETPDSWRLVLAVILLVSVGFHVFKLFVTDADSKLADILQ